MAAGWGTGWGTGRGSGSVQAIVQKTLMLLTLLALLAVTACGSTEVTATGQGAGSDDSGTTGGPAAGDPFGDATWQLSAATVDGAVLALLDTHPVTIAVSGVGTLGGTSACNHYGGDYTLGGVGDDGVAVLTLGSMSMTEMACFPDEVGRLESVYLAALARVTTVARPGDELVLAGEGVELRFVARVPEPDAALTATTWILDSVIDGDAVSSTVMSPNAWEATLEISGDGVLNASGGCNGIGGTIVIAGDRWEPAELVSTRRGCEPALMDQESRVHRVLSGGPTWSTEGRSLTLMLDDGTGLRYLARSTD